MWVRLFWWGGGREGRKGGRVGPASAGGCGGACGEIDDFEALGDKLLPLDGEVDPGPSGTDIRILRLGLGGAT